MMRAAILQNSIGIGGRSKVIAEAISVLKSKFEIIDIHTLSDKSGKCRFFDHYAVDEDTVNIVSYSTLVPGTIYQQLFLNFLAQKKLTEYDLVFNSNNSIQFLPTQVEYIHYIHFPGPAIPDVDPKYEKISYQMMSLPFRGLFPLLNNTISGTVFANSKYTADYVQKIYAQSDVDILYPPSLGSVEFDGFSGNGVVSLGSFHPNKRQLFQIRIAKEFPETDFRIIGSKSSKKYFRRCVKFIDEENISNVELYPNASDGRVTELLEQSQIFVHSMKNEKFGIATVEALNKGCIPVVHDSGGQKEIVPDTSFRFRNENQCKNIIKAAFAGHEPNFADIDSHLARYTEKRFKSRLAKYVD